LHGYLSNDIWKNLYHHLFFGKNFWDQHKAVFNVEIFIEKPLNIIIPLCYWSNQKNILIIDEQK